MKYYHKDEKRMKTKERSKSAKCYELMRQEEMERQCEEFFISLDCKDIEVESHEDDGVSNVNTPSMEEKTAPYDVEIAMGTTNDLQGVSLNPLDLLMNKKLSDTLSYDVGQSLTIFDGEPCWGVSKKEQEHSSYFVPCPNTLNMLYSWKADFNLAMVAMEGITNVLFTPHFHYYMLLRLMMSLDAGLYLFIWRNGMLCLSLCNLSNVEYTSRDNAKHAAFMCFSMGFNCEVPLTYVVTFGSKGTVLVTVLGSVIVQGIVQNLKLDHEPGFDNMSRLELYWGSQNTNDRSFVGINSPWFELNINQKKLDVNRNDVGVESYGANAELGALVSDFPWECWFVKNVVEVMVEHKPSSKGMDVSLLLLLTDKPKHSDLCTLNAQLLCVNLRPRHVIVAFDPGGIQSKVQNKIHPKTSREGMGLVCYKVDGSLIVVDVVLMIPRYFILIFDPGGMDVKPSLQVAFEQVSLNHLNSFKEAHNKLIMNYLFSIKSWCGFWSLIIVKFEDKFLLNLGSLQQEL